MRPLLWMQDGRRTGVRESWNEVAVGVGESLGGRGLQGADRGCRGDERGGR